MSVTSDITACYYSPSALPAQHRFFGGVGGGGGGVVGGEGESNNNKLLRYYQAIRLPRNNLRLKEVCQVHTWKSGVNYLDNHLDQNSSVGQNAVA